jgi:hypothetical protein
VLLLVLGGVAWVVSRLGVDDRPNDAGPGKTPSPTAEAQDEQPASSTSAEAKEEFVRDYFAKAPGGSDEAWEMLGPSLQEQGRESYDGFWRSIESVEVTSAEAREGSDTVEVTLTYRGTDGRVSTERKREGLIRSDDGGYLLDTDVPAG